MTYKGTVDVGAGLLALGTMLEWLPHIAAVLTVIWYGIRIYEWARVRIFKRDFDKMTEIL